MNETLQRVAAFARDHSVAVALGLYVVSLALRLAFIGETYDEPEFRYPLPGLDIDTTWRAAQHIREGRELSFEAMLCSAPLFPYLVAGLQEILGDSMWVHRIAIAVLGSLRFPLLWLLARRLTGSATASLVATLLLAVVPSVVYFDTVLIKASIDLTLLVALLWVVTAELPGTRGRLVRRGLAIGGLLSLQFLSQLNTFLYVFPVGLYLWLDRRIPRRSRILVTGSAAVVFTIVFAGFSLRTEWMAGAPKRFLGRAGVDMHIGFQPEATGYYKRLKNQPGYPYGHTFLSRIAMEVRLGRPISARESDLQYRGRAFLFAVRNPGRASTLIGKKALYFFNDFEIRGNEYLGWIQGYSIVARLPVGFGWLVVLGALGAVALWAGRKRRLLLLLGGVVVVLLIANILTFVIWRFRLPAVIPLTIMSACGLAFARDRLAACLEIGAHLKARIRAGAAVVVPALLAGTVAFWPVLSTAGEKFLSTSKTNSQKSLTATSRRSRLDALRSVAAPTPEQRRERARLYAELHRYTDAYHELEAIIEDSVDDDRARARYLTYLMWLGDYDRARAFLGGLEQRSPRLAQRAISQQHPHIRRALRSFILNPAARPN